MENNHPCGCIPMRPFISNSLRLLVELLEQAEQRRKAAEASQATQPVTHEERTDR